MREDGTITVAFVGNPNCGKTTLFNAYTGARLKVANWPGVTVEKKEGMFTFHGRQYKLVDLPGTYSLTSYTMEEKLTRQYIMEDEVDVIIDVVDASSLERNLYLSLQLIELGKPMVIALNMMDVVEERGMEIDLHRLPEMLGVPCIPVSARKRTGLDVLMHAVAHHYQTNDTVMAHHHEEIERQSHHIHGHHKEFAMVYPDEVEDKIDEISAMLREKYGELSNLRWLSIKILVQDEEILGKYPLDFPVDYRIDYETEMINSKYDFIEEVVGECLFHKEEKAQLTDRVDHFLVHPVFAIPIFLLIMAGVFFLTFTVGDWLKGYFELALDYLCAGVRSLFEHVGVAPFLTSLVVDGIIGGVGGILTFLPNLFILFLALAVLEDSGYMARVAYVMDGIMGKLGLSGRAFIPMLLGFGCTVPAVMASRTLEDQKDRLRTILITPFMSCSARLPVYVLFAGMFFQKNKMLVAYSLYLLGVLVAIGVALVLHWFEKKETYYTLLIELPEYKSPNLRTVAIYVWEKIKDYLTKAGTTIFITSVIMWFLLNLGPHGLAAGMDQSFGAMLGKAILPIFKPIGLGYWQIVVALISGLAAKEMVVSSCNVLFGVSDVAAGTGNTVMLQTLSALGFGPVNAYALMVFSLLYPPCLAAVATIRKESGSTAFTVKAVAFQMILAWCMAGVFYWGLHGLVG